MSHIVTIETQLRDADALDAACHRLDLPAPEEGRALLFSGVVEGTIVRLPGWRYPVVADLQAGTLRTTTTAAPGATRRRWAACCRPTRSRRPGSRPAAAATRSASRPWPTGPSS